MFSDAPTAEKELLVGAEDRLAEAAAGSELVARDRVNSTHLLTGLLGQLRYDDVVVVFNPSRSRPARDAWGRLALPR